MRARALTIAAVLAVACSDKPAPRVETPPARAVTPPAPPPVVAPPAVDPTPDPPPPPPPPTTVAATPPTCVRDERVRGSACCSNPARAAGRGRDDKFPGMPFVSCHGPRIGLPCRAKGDCDIACSCDKSEHLHPGDGPQGPADGTRGFVGRCAGTLQIGVWMCQIDEHGKVSHIIVD